MTKEDIHKEIVSILNEYQSNHGSPLKRESFENSGGNYHTHKNSILKDSFHKECLTPNVTVPSTFKHTNPPHIHQTESRS